MSHYDRIPAEFSEWVIRLLDGSITDEQFAQLEHEMEHNEAALIHYFEFISTYAGLMDLGQASPVPMVFFDKKDESLSPEELFDLFKPAHPIKLEAGKAGPINFDLSKPEEEKKRQIEDYARQQLETFLAQEHRDHQEPQFQNAGWDFLLVIDKVTEISKWLFRKGIKVSKTVAVCLVVLLFILISLHFYKMSFTREIATLNASLNAKFADNQTIVSGERLTGRRDPYLLQTGLIEIGFDGGAKVLLEAPTTFRLKSTDRIVLHVGQLFVHIPPYAQGFTVETPNSRIIDMGTEFGVRVEQDGTSDLHLFKGKAALTSDSAESGAKRTLTLRAGQAKRVGVGGHVRDIPIEEQAFVRSFYLNTGFVWRGEPLSLADILGGGNGFGKVVRPMGIDPASGVVGSGEVNNIGKRVGKRGYFPVQGFPAVDGVFVPDKDQNPLIVSSKGHVFNECPDTTFNWWNYIINQPQFGIKELQYFSARFNNRIFGTPENPGIYMHTNAGLTFDLDVIRAIHPGFTLRQFSTICGIVEGEDLANRAGFLVLVDGEKRGEFHAVSDTTGRYGDIIVPLKENDHFLTLITVDDGDDIDHDWTLFGLPYLTIEEKS